jgi:hypothetical protein
MLNVDSAEKPQMLKKQQLKTPPNQSSHSKKIAHNRSWRVLYLTAFHGFLVIFQNMGFFQQNQHLTFRLTPVAGWLAGIVTVYYVLTLIFWVDLFMISF